MHVPTAPPGTHPIGNYRVQIDPQTRQAVIDVQCAGQWFPVAAQTPQDGQTLIALLQSPFCTVQDGWIVGRRSP